MARILVIDDSTFQRQMVRDFLEKAGHQVEEFLPLSALEVVEKITAWPPDLVLTDFAMPHVDGLEVARLIRRARPDLPVVMLTAARDSGRDARLQTMGVRKILHKPLAGEALVKALEGLI